MTTKQHIVVPVLLIATVLTLVAKKLSLPFSSLLTIMVLDALGAYFLLSSIRFRKKKSPGSRTQVQLDFGLNHIVYCACSFALLINLQHWRGAELWGKIMFIVLLAYSIGLVISLDRLKKTDTKNRTAIYLHTFLPFFFFFLLLTLAVISTPRQFYNLFHGQTYEQFVRHRYPEEVAIAYVNRSKPMDELSMRRAKNNYDQAMQKISQSEYEVALKLLHKSIDLNPDDAQAYYERGLLRLTKLDISVYMAQDALSDFNRALQLQPDMEAAQGGKAMAEKYIRDNSNLDSKQ